MRNLSLRRACPALLPIVAAAALAAPSAVAGSAGPVAPHAQLFVPAPNPGAVQQIADLRASGDAADAALLEKMESYSHGVWLTEPSASDVRDAVKQTFREAAHQRSAVPVFVAYNIPGRDCAGFSAGGAKTLAEYEAWIDAVANGIGGHRALLVLEPDSLGLLPQTDCGSTEFTDADRFAALDYAVDRLGALPHLKVYLDATHPAWLAVGDIASRLLQAGVQRADGFFLNVSNYQYTANDVFYGTWVSDCIAYVTRVNAGDFGSCGNQYWDGGPATGWTGAALSPYQVWSDQPYSGNPADLVWNTVGIDSRYASILGSVQPTTHFVVDTSRDGRGPWDWAAAGYPSAGAARDWCNPPGRGLGARPTTATGNPLVDAYLWIKVPGESDGQCTRGASGPTDPEWGIVDPAAGAWFPQQALQLAQLAVSPLG